MQDITGSITLHDQFGTPVQFAISAADPKAFEANRNKLARAMTSAGYYTALPRRKGGFDFPLANLATFDFAVIGARFGKRTQDGDTQYGVWHGGQFYRARVLEPVEDRKKKLSLPLKVKFSRGANDGDPPEIVEKSDGEFSYVPLISFTFRNGDYKLPGFDVPQGTTPVALQIPEIVEKLNLKPAAQAAAPVDENQQKAAQHIYGLIRQHDDSAPKDDRQMQRYAERIASGVMQGDIRFGEMSMDGMRDVYKHLQAHYKN